MSAQVGNGERPLVSVVIPTRDRLEFLRSALASVNAQSYAGPIECLVVFDQSEPRLPEVELAPARTVRALVNDRTPGLAGARNSGALAARGDLVAFLDDDDEWLPDKLGRQVELLDTTGAATATSGIRVCYGEREVDRSSSTELVSFGDLLRSRRTELHPSTILVRRSELLDRIGLVDEQIPGSYAEDYEWLLRAARVSSIAAVREPLVRVRWHRSSFFAARWETITRALEYLLAKYPEFEREPAGLARIFGQLAFAHAASGNAARARAYARRALRLRRTQPRAYLALLVSFGVVRAENILRLAHNFGRGI